MQSSWYHLIMTTSTDQSALLLFAHGSSDPGWAAPFVKLKVAIQAREPDKIVALAFLERMEPSFDDAVTALQKQAVKQITVAPIFLAIGGHMRNDLPKLIEETQSRILALAADWPKLAHVNTREELDGARLEF